MESGERQGNEVFWDVFSSRGGLTNLIMCQAGVEEMGGDELIPTVPGREGR